MSKLSSNDSEAIFSSAMGKKFIPFVVEPEKDAEKESEENSVSENKESSEITEKEKTAVLDPPPTKSAQESATEIIHVPQAPVAKIEEDNFKTLPSILENLRLSRNYMDFETSYLEVSSRMLEQKLDKPIGTTLLADDIERLKEISRKRNRSLGAMINIILFAYKQSIEANEEMPAMPIADLATYIFKQKGYGKKSSEFISIRLLKENSAFLKKIVEKTGERKSTLLCLIIHVYLELCMS